MTESLGTFQTGIGHALQGLGPCPIDANSAGFRFTAKVRRSWCKGRAITAAREVLTMLTDTDRRRLLDEYVDRGGGLAFFLPAESEAFLAFLAPRLPDPSHALSLCRMDQALALARAGVATFVPPREGVPGGRVKPGRHAALVWFYADPSAILRALQSGSPPPVGAPDHAVLVGPGLPNLFRMATEEEAALWARLPATEAAPDLLERLLAEGVVAYSE